MHKNKYISCDRLINGIDFEIDNIELCCFRCHKGGGIIPLCEVKNGNIDFDSFFSARDKYIKENKAGKINPKCEGCLNLEKKEWNEKPVIKYIHFNHWTHCNSNCEYCYTKKDPKYKGGVQHYNALPILKEILSKIEFSPSGEITFAGGEPALLDEFDDIIDYLLDIGAKKIIIHSSGIKYSKAIERGLKENKIQLVISHDSGSSEIYEKIKNTYTYDEVWKNTAEYAKISSKNVYSKYIIIPKVNDNKEEIKKWLNKAHECSIKTIIADIEHDFYNQNKNNFRECLRILSLCEYIKNAAKSLGIEVEFYNSAIYLYEKYKLFIPLFKYSYYFLELLILAFPLLIGNLGHILIGGTDILIVSKYNINSLAAISIANSILFTIFIFGLGILDAITIILSNKLGQREHIKGYLLSSLIFSAFLAVIFTLLCYSSIFLVDRLSFETHLVPLIKQYIKIVSFSMFGMFLYQGVKVFLQAYEIVKFPNLLLLGAVIVNLIFDIVFVFGFFGLPAMGSKGAAIATLCVRSLMGIAMLVYIFKSINFKSKIDLSYMKQILKIGIPIGTALLLEFLAFNIITILVGRDSGILSAAHNILMLIPSTTFTVPLAIATAVAIKVSYYYGAKKCKEVKNYSYAGVIMGVSFMAFCSLILSLFPAQIIKLFTDNAQVLNISLPLILIAAMYQVFDGFQVITGGILKGFKMTKVVSSTVLCGYWVIGMPVAFILVRYFNYSLKGYWIALAVALFSMGMIQALIAKYKFNKFKKTCQD